MALEPRASRKPSIFVWTVIVLSGLYVGLRYVAPWLSVLAGLSPIPAPIPRFALVMYMTCAAVGALVYASSDEERWRSFLGPVVRLFVMRPRGARQRQLAMLAALPLLAGWLVWQRIRPASQTGAILRVQHPTLPGAYGDLENPLRLLAEDERREEELQGVVLYQKNCRPCHGTKADGNGPLARGLRLRPVDFTDAGTLATLVEPYPFWRIRKGALGLSAVATPWNSAMPAWEKELTDNEVWRIIMAEYRIAGTEPRKPERTEP